MIKKILLALLLIPFILIVLPQLNILGTKIEYIDTYFKEQNVSISNFKKGYGLYPTEKIKVEYIPPVESSRRLDNEEFNYLNSVIRSRISLSELIDVKFESSFQDNRFEFVFEFPEYYETPSKYVDWFLADGEISFSTAEENSSLIDINDYDIEGELYIDFLPQAGSNLVFNFNSDLENTLNGAFATNQNQIFYMSIDNQISYFVTPYDQYVETKPTTVRAFPATSTITTLQELNDYLRISRTYFNSDAINLSRYNKSISSETISAVNKNLSLSLIALGVGLFTLLPIILIALINKDIKLNDLKNNRRALLKYIAKRVVLVGIFNLVLVFFLKFSGAVLSIYLLLGYLTSVMLFEYLILNLDRIKKDVNLYLIVLFILILILLKFSHLSYEVSNFIAVMQLGIISFWLTKLYHKTFKSLNLIKNLE